MNSENAASAAPAELCPLVSITRDRVEGFIEKLDGVASYIIGIEGMLIDSFSDEHGTLDVHASDEDVRPIAEASAAFHVLSDVKTSLQIEIEMAALPGAEPTDGRMSASSIAAATGLSHETLKSAIEQVGGVFSQQPIDLFNIDPLDLIAAFVREWVCHMTDIEKANSQIKVLEARLALAKVEVEQMRQGTYNPEAAAEAKFDAIDKRRGGRVEINFGKGVVIAESDLDAAIAARRAGLI